MKPAGNPQKKSGRRLSLAAFGILTAVWAILYLPHLRDSPSWYGDETLTLMIGRSLFSGEGLDRSLYATFWHPSYSYQPFYAWAVGFFASLAGGDILGARLLNSLLALATSILIATFGARPLGRLPAFFAALLLLATPQGLIHFRWIYPHNAVAFGFCLVVLMLLRRSKPSVNWAAGVGLAFAAASHPLFAHGALAAWLCRIKRPGAWLPMAIPPAIVLVAGIGWTIARQWPEIWVFDDIKNLAGFYGSYSSEHGAGWQALRNVVVFYTQDPFHLVGFLCALVCLNRRTYVLPGFLAVVSGLLLQNRQNLPVFYYQAMTFVPVLVLCYAGALRRAIVFVRWQRRTRLLALGIPILALLIPVVLIITAIPTVSSGRLVPRNQPWTTQNVREVEVAAEWINAHTGPDDLVVCHQNIGWLLNCRTVDLMQATAWAGLPTFTFEKAIPRERFAFDADLSRARFLVIGDIDSRWTIGQPNVIRILERASEDRWPVVWQGDHYMIVANPSFH